MALVNYDNSDSELSDTALEEASDGAHREDADRVEPEYKMRVPKSAARSTSMPPISNSLVASKTKTGKVLLSVPALEELDSSTDESDHEQGSTAKQNLKKIPKGVNQKAVGLLSLLPPTRAPVSRQGSKPVVMIPHQLAIKRPAPGHLIKRTESGETDDHANTSNARDSDDGEDVFEETSSSFFSFFQPENDNQQAVAELRAATASSILQAMATNVEQPALLENNHEPESSEPVVVSASMGTTQRASAPYKPTTSLCRIDPSVLSEVDVPKKESTLEEESMEEDAACWTEHTFIPGPERKRARLTQPGTRSIPVHDLLTTSNQQIREVNQADLTAGADLELMKSVTADESQYRSHRSAQDDDPGKLAHRKHQITWLAYQAQENELELEKRWAEARRNKASSRSKYGF